MMVLHRRRTLFEFLILQSIFLEWSDSDKIKFLPFFLKGLATTTLDKATAKSTIKEAMDALTAGCGPSADKYMDMFFNKKRKKEETMLAHGLKLQEYLTKGHARG
jgi:hypothetical protein